MFRKRRNQHLSPKTQCHHLAWIQSISHRKLFLLLITWGLTNYPGVKGLQGEGWILGIAFLNHHHHHHPSGMRSYRSLFGARRCQGHCLYPAIAAILIILTPCFLIGWFHLLDGSRTEMPAAGSSSKWKLDSLWDSYEFFFRLPWQDIMRCGKLIRWYNFLYSPMKIAAMGRTTLIK